MSIEGFEFAEYSFPANPIQTRTTDHKSPPVFGRFWFDIREFNHRERERQWQRETRVRTGERTRCFMTM